MNAYTELAQWVVEQFVRSGHVPPLFPNHLLHLQTIPSAGVFVGIHMKNGDLRGCMGTIEPQTTSMLHEITANAVSACSRDPRFPPIMEEELPGLCYKVDVLSPLSEVANVADLDPTRYGVLVSSSDTRRGVLLPNLPGIETVDQQMSIACQKAHISRQTDTFRIYRFTTTRYI